MDLKQLNQLDPKLKETYERVMGTSAKPIPMPSPFVPKSPTQPLQPQPIKQQPIQSSQPKPIQAQPTHPQAMQKPQLKNIKKKNQILPVFLAVGGIAFLIGYAFFWIKFFNLKLPFLPF